MMRLIKNSLVHRRVGRAGSSSTASMPYVKGIVSLDFHLSLSSTTVIPYSPRFSWRFLDFFYVLYSTLLHLPPLGFHNVGGCWD
jgi:hypothetical protein